MTAMTDMTAAITATNHTVSLTEEITAMMCTGTSIAAKTSAADTAMNRGTQDSVSRSSGHRAAVCA